MDMVITIPVVLLLLALIWLIVCYNSLVACRNRFQSAFAQIDVQLQRRYDLIPNLVDTVKAYMRHERETLEAVVSARNAAQDAAQRAKQGDSKDAAALLALAGAETLLTDSLFHLFARVEAYPELKASRNLLSLQEALVTTENRVAFARQGYNDAVMHYNTRLESFPVNLFARRFGFTPGAMWLTEAEAARRPLSTRFA